MTQPKSPAKMDDEGLKIAIDVYWKNRQATHAESIAEAIQAYLKYVNSPYWAKPPSDENKLVEEMAEALYQYDPYIFIKGARVRAKWSDLHEDSKNYRRDTIKALLPLIRKAIGGV